MNEDNDAGMEALAETLARLNSPFVHVYHPETGKLMAMFPKVKNHAQGSPERRAQEDEWEARSIAMHKAQGTAARSRPDRPSPACAGSRRWPVRRPH